MRYLLLLLLMAAVAVLAPASAQEWPPDPPPAQPKAKQKAKAKPAPRVQDDTQELTPAQIQRAQERDPPPGSPKSMPEAVKRPPKGGGGPAARQIACSGAFAADSSHIRLAQVFGSQNVAYTEVEGPENSKLMASVLFPRDPQRRLEMLWRNGPSRTGTQVIAINGKSAWAAPRGIKLGMTVAAVEKLNGKPFKLSGFATDGSTATDWMGGAMLNLPGGCKLGVRLSADQRAPQEALSQVKSAKEMESSDASVRAVRATVSEILIGY